MTQYVANVARIYRQAIDDYFSDPLCYEEKKTYYKSEIEKGTYRQFTTGFYFNKPEHEAQIYDTNTYVQNYTYLGLIHEKTLNGCYGFIQKNKFAVGDSIEIMKPSGEVISAIVRKMLDEKGQVITDCPHPGMQVYIDVDYALEEFDIMRKEDN